MTKNTEKILKLRALADQDGFINMIQADIQRHLRITYRQYKTYAAEAEVTCIQGEEAMKISTERRLAARATYTVPERKPAVIGSIFYDKQRERNDRVHQDFLEALPSFRWSGKCEFYATQPRQKAYIKKEDNENA